jgi:hypothetical protein
MFPLVSPPPKESGVSYIATVYITYPVLSEAVLLLLAIWIVVSTSEMQSVNSIKMHPVFLKCVTLTMKSLAAKIIIASGSNYFKGP